MTVPTVSDRVPTVSGDAVEVTVSTVSVSLIGDTVDADTVSQSQTPDRDRVPASDADARVAAFIADAKRRRDRIQAVRATHQARRNAGLARRHEWKIQRLEGEPMAGDTTITIVGNLVDDPELRFTPSGLAVAKFRVASTPRSFNKNTNAWEDGEALFLTGTVWRQAAENVSESLTKGMRVIVQGRLKQHSYETQQGERRTVYEIDVDEIGPSLRNATAKVTKAAARDKAPATDDPWGTAKPAARGGFGQPAAQADDAPPF